MGSLAVGAGADALLVDVDADVTAAADAAAWGAFSNAGQTCLGVERVYLTGNQALVRLLLAQKRLDEAARDLLGIVLVVGQRLGGGLRGAI